MTMTNDDVGVITPLYLIVVSYMGKKCIYVWGDIMGGIQIINNNTKYGTHYWVPKWHFKPFTGARMRGAVETQNSSLFINILYSQSKKLIITGANISVRFIQMIV